MACKQTLLARPLETAHVTRGGRGEGSERERCTDRTRALHGRVGERVFAAEMRGDVEAG